MSQLRYCKSCNENTLHDKFKDGLVVGEKADAFERAFFGVFTLGFSEIIGDYWYKCQKCGRKIRQK